MVFPILFVSVVREWRFSRRLKLTAGLGLLAGCAAVRGLEWWFAGLLGGRQSLELWGFDYFSMNLNAFINPSTRSRVLPPLPLGAGQYEGFAYAGLGFLALGVAALVVSFRRPKETGLRERWRRFYAWGHLPLALDHPGLLRSIVICDALPESLPDAAAIWGPRIPLRTETTRHLIRALCS